MPELSGYFTPTVRNLLLGLAFILAIQWGAGQPFLDLLAWHTFNGGFQPWQPLTSLLIASPRLSEMLFDWLVIVFSLEVVRRVMGDRALIRALAGSTAAAVAFALVADGLGLVRPSLHGGQGPVVTALLTLFCFTMPNARVMLMFAIPLQASWMGWLVGVIAVYITAASRDLGAFLSLGGWIGALLWVRFWDDLLRRTKMRWQRRRAERNVGRFSVIEGGRGDRQRDWIN